MHLRPSPPLQLWLLCLSAAVALTSAHPPGRQQTTDTQTSHAHLAGEGGSHNRLLFEPATGENKNWRQQPQRYSVDFSQDQRGTKASDPKCVTTEAKHGGKKADCSSLGLVDLTDLLLRLELRPEAYTVLNLSLNAITDIPSRALASFSNVLDLSLAHNQLSHLGDGSFGGLYNLKELDLQGNRLVMGDVYNLSEKVFQHLGNLTALYLNNNTKPQASTQPQTLGYPDGALASLTSLERLYIDGLTNQTFGPGFSNMTSLSYLSLDGYRGPCDLGYLGWDTFENLRQLSSLQMARCGLHVDRIDPGVLAPLDRLQGLDVSRNVDLNLDGLVPLLEGQRNSKRLLKLNVNLVVNPYSISRCLSNDLAKALPRSLIYLNAEFNNLEMVSDQVFENLPSNLTYLTLSGNPFFFGNYLKNFHKMKNLRVLIMNGWSKGFALPTYYSATDQQPTSKCTFGPRSKAEPLVLKLPPRLERLEMNQAFLSFTVTNFTVSPNNSLKQLSLAENNIPQLYGPVSGLEKLEELNLISNNIKTFSESFFRSFRNLRVLRLGHNVCGHIISSAERDKKMFPESLRELYLSYNSIKNFQLDLNATLPNLETLDLRHTGLGNFSTIVTGMTSLRMLNLAGNTLYRMSDEVTAAISSIPGLTVNITANDIGCYCQNLDFLKWLVTYPNLADRNLTGFSCNFPDSIQAVPDLRLLFDQMQRKCSDNRFLLHVSISAVASVVLIILVFVAYRFRWKLRFWYYTLDPRVSSNRSSRKEDGFQQDVLAAYCQEDEDFAEETLHDSLVSLGVSVRLQGRDFRPGVPIFRDIVESVQACRRTLVVLTPKMARNSWCRATVNLAAVEAQRSGRPVLVFFFLKPVEPAELGTELLFHMHSATLIYYPPREIWPNRKAMGLFWRKLRSAIR